MTLPLHAEVPPATAERPCDHDTADTAAARLEFLLHDGPAPGSAVLRARGELEASTTDLLLGAVDRAARRGRTDLELDLAEVVFCDVCGIDAVLAARRRLRAIGGELRLRRVRPFLRHVLGVLNLDEVVAG
ncbi:STAS domain-containing protein [Kineococcus esterisolvens]|uniref:STAS domain-containing protein n=1 Tax=unclassified Kineococcus TaxID=2621656 RepID=UPI003D7F177D